jgi:hypothetical protein
VIAIGGETPGRFASWLVEELADALPGTIRTLPAAASGNLEPTV